MHNVFSMETLVSGLLCSMPYMTTNKALVSSSASQMYFQCAPSVSFQVSLYDGVISRPRS